MDIYSGDICSNSQLHPDIPKQSTPNGSNAYLYQTTSGLWSGSGAYDTCGENDQFMNYMDYVTDQNMVMFSIDQCNDMRNVIQSSGLFDLQQVSIVGIPDKPRDLILLDKNSRYLDIEWYGKELNTNSVTQYRLELRRLTEDIFVSAIKKFNKWFE